MNVRVVGTVAVTALLLTGCVSPEAVRRRGGGPGADPGNHSAVVEMHAGSKMYYRTPCRTVNVKCSGPLPNSGT